MSKHYCLLTKLETHETAQQTAYAQLQSAVEVLTNTLKISKKLSIKQYQSLLVQIKDVTAIVSSEVQEESAFDRQFHKLRNIFQNLNNEQVGIFSSELMATDSNRGAVTDKYLILNAQQE